MRLAFKNLMARKMSTLKVLISLIVMIVIMCVFTAYSVALTDESKKVIGSYRAGHYFTTSNYSMLTDYAVNNLKAIDGVGEVKQKAVYNHPSNLRDMAFSIDGQDYICPHFIYDGNDNSVDDPFHTGDVGLVMSGDHIVANNETLEHEFRWKNIDPVIAGTDIVEGNEIVLSELFLREFNLGTDIVGKSINVTIGEKTYQNMKIVGVLSAQYYNLTGINRNYFITSFDSEIYKEASKNVRHSTYVYVADYMLSKNIAEAMVELNYLKISAGSEYGMVMASTVTIIGSVLSGVMLTVGVGILGALILNMVFSMRYMILKKADFYGIISAYGTKNQGIFNILFFEMFFVAAIAGAFAYLLSYGIVFLLDYILSYMVGIGVVFSGINFAITFGVAFLFTLFVILAVTIVNYIAFTRKNTMKMLGRAVSG